MDEISQDTETPSAAGLFVGRESGTAANVYLQPEAGAYLVALVAET